MSSEEEAFEIYQKLKQRFSQGGFNMRKWGTNSKSLSERIKNSSENATSPKRNENEENFEISEDDESFAKHASNIVCNEDEAKVLGISWNKTTDKFDFDLSSFVEAAKQEPPTKRTELSTTARFYDPIGLLSPVIVPLKEIFQEICKLKIDWDSCLPEEICEKWRNIVNDIAKVSSIEYDRSLLGDIEIHDIMSIQLHGFTDVSKIAYGACIYLRIETKTGIFVRLVSAKTRITPLKEETIPRLELMAALTLSQLIFIFILQYLYRLE